MNITFYNFTSFRTSCNQDPNLLSYHSVLSSNRMRMYNAMCC
ncbi:hypothetical protein [Sphingobacterium spiritivorum]